MSHGTERDATSPSSDEGYRAVVERYRDDPNQCTIFPADGDRDEQATAWVSAQEPSYVDLWSVR